MIKRVWLSLVVVASVGAGPSVLAQFALKPDMPIAVVGQRNFETDPYLRTQRPSVSEDDVKAMVEILHLSEAQRASVLELHEGYVAEYMRQVAVLHKLVEAVDKARAAGADNLQAVTREHWLGYFSLRDTSDKAEKSLLADVKSLLTDEQREQYLPTLERWRRREALVSVAPASLTLWATVDLIKLLKAAGLSALEREAVRPVLEAYELQVDAPLRERLLLLQEWRERHADPWEPKDQAFRTRSADIGITLAEANKRNLRLVKDALGAEHGAQVEAAARRLAYAEVYERKSDPGAVIAQALKLEDLTQPQRDKVTELGRTYARDVQQIDKAQCDRLDQLDDAVVKRLRMTAEERQRAPFVGEMTTMDLINERERFERPVLEAITAVLTPSQRSGVTWPDGWPWPQP